MSIRSLESQLTLSADVSGLLAGLEAADKRVQALGAGLTKAFQDPVLHFGFELVSLGWEKILGGFEKQQQRLHDLAMQYDSATIAAAARADAASLRADLAEAAKVSPRTQREEELRAYEAETRKMAAEGGRGGPTSGFSFLSETWSEFNAWTDRLGVQLNAKTNELARDAGFGTKTEGPLESLFKGAANILGGAIVNEGGHASGMSKGQLDQLDRIYQWMVSQGGG